MRKTKKNRNKNRKRNTLAKIRRKLYSKRKGRGIEASKIIPSKIPISREEVLRLRRERKTLKRETRAAEKAIATQRAEEDAIINRFLTDTEAASARAVRDAAREEFEKAEALIALKERGISREEVLRLRRERKTMKKETRAAEKVIAAEKAEADIRARIQAKAAEKAETAPRPALDFAAWQERNKKRNEDEAKRQAAPVLYSKPFLVDGVRLVRSLFGPNVQIPDRAIDAHKQVIYITSDER
jgi:hypothetical protein